MCVAVTLGAGTWLDGKEVEQMNRANADGVGVAWAKDGLVEWYKTTKVDPDYIARMIYAFREFPRLVHFRLSTAGGTRPELCHPFEIGPLANCDPRGSSTRVMIHNGHWHKWNDVHKMLSSEGLLPSGPWSDSRLVAYLSHDDPEWLESIGGRVAVMRGNGDIHRIGDWQELRPDLWVSNKIWETTNYTRGGYTGFRHWKGWAWNEKEHDAYYAEEVASAKEAAAKSTEESKSLEELNGDENRKRRASKAERRAARRDERKARKAAAKAASRAVDGTLRPEDSGRHSQGNGTANVSAGFIGHEPGITRFVGVKPSDLDKVTQVGGEPVLCTNGRWYKAIVVKGTPTVVEVIPSDSEGPAC